MSRGTMKSSKVVFTSLAKLNTKITEASEETILDGEILVRCTGCTFSAHCSFTLFLTLIFHLFRSLSQIHDDQGKALQDPSDFRLQDWKARTRQV
jgi:hypothetical protein